MIKKLFILFFALYINSGVCGISVLGTRFLMNNDMAHLNIKIENDNESDYLIKSVLDDKGFIISPPLFLLPKNSSHVVTVIPKEKKQYEKDKILNLTITAIPKSTLNDESNSVSLAVRNHFKIIYRHAKIHDSKFAGIKVTSENDTCFLSNHSDFVFTMSLSKIKDDLQSMLINLPPDGKIVMENTNVSSGCSMWVNFYNEYNDIIKKIKLTK